MSLPTWQFSRHLLRILVPLLVVLAVILWMLHRAEVNALHSIATAEDRHQIQLASQMIAAELDMLRSDTLYLAEQAALQPWLDSGDPATLEHLVDDLLAFVRLRGLYDQARLLDGNGTELVRINWNQGQPRSEAVNELQNKSRRYSVNRILALEQGQIYTSPFDLNVESNGIEQSTRPMIRLGTPLFDREGHKRGLIVLSYMGQRLLNRLRHSNPRNDRGLWLLNAGGYWLLGPEPELEWGFMYPERVDVRFPERYGEVWEAIQSGPPRAQLERGEGIFSYARLEPEASPLGAAGERWILVTYTPASVLRAKAASHTRNLFIAFFVLALLLMAVSAMIARKDQQRRRIEARIRESEARFRGLLESAPDAIVIVDRDGCINLVNSQTEKCFGYSRDELLGKPVELLVPERYRGAHSAYREGYVTSPVARLMGAEMELYGRRKDGGEFPVEISLSPLETEQGLLVSSIVRDISARKQAEEAQRQMQARYQELVNNLPVGVYRNTPGRDGRFLEVNPAMKEIFEAESVEELLAHPVRDLYCDAALRDAFSDKILRQGYIKAEELQLKTLRGRIFYAAITAVVKKDAAGGIYFDGVVEDISERKESELRIQLLNKSLQSRSKELEIINRELEAFSYSVSHDLRAPLRAMDGFSRTLLDEYADVLDDKGKDRLRRIRAAAQRMALLIDDLLQLSRVSRAELRRNPVDLSLMAKEIMDELRQREPHRRVQFSVQPELNTQGDPTLLRVVLDNLLGNAWKFTARRPLAVIEVGGSGNGGEYTYFVRDNGAGFDMAYADKLFGAFQRLHDSDEFPGTGIGLATVQRVIHKHGGRIWAESRVGQGATFYFTLK